MLESIRPFLSHPVVQGAIAGAVAATAIDRAAFRQWKSFDEARQYSWGMAVWRGLQGALYGASVALGLGF